MRKTVSETVLPCQPPRAPPAASVLVWVAMAPGWVVGATWWKGWWLAVGAEWQLWLLRRRGWQVQERRGWPPGPPSRPVGGPGGSDRTSLPHSHRCTHRWRPAPRPHHHSGCSCHGDRGCWHTGLWKTENNRANKYKQESQTVLSFHVLIYGSCLYYFLLCYMWF